MEDISKETTYLLTYLSCLYK